MVDNRQTTNNVHNPQNTAISFGDNSPNTVTNNYNQESTDLTKTLLEELNTSDMNDIQKEELRELIETVHTESNAEKPKKTVLKSVLETSKSIIDTATKSPALIEAYSKWAQFFQNPPTF